MLFRKETLERIAVGEVTVAFRRWKRPTVKAGGTLRTRIGMLAIVSVEALDDQGVSDGDAVKAGFADANAVLEAFPPAPDRRLYRVTFRPAGPDPRIELRERTTLTQAEVDEIERRLGVIDRRSPTGPWTRPTLDVIAKRPGVRAADLAHQLGQERLPFKANVRKLKALGLTESLETGYRLSPRGRAYLRAQAPRTPV